MKHVFGLSQIQRVFFFASLVLAFLFVPQNVFAAERYAIFNTAVGGDCPLIGVWNSVTSTCTLHQDIPDGYIDILDSGITLDGAGHTLNANNAPFGEPAVHVDTSDNVIVRNLRTLGGQFGIYFDSSSFGIAENNTVTAFIGINFFNASDGRISGNFLDANGSTDISISAFSNIVVEQNVIETEGDMGISVSNVETGTFSGNTVTGPSIGFELRGQSSDLKIFENTFSQSFEAAFLMEGIEFEGINVHNNIFMDSEVGVLIEGGGGDPGPGPGPSVSSLFRQIKFSFKRVLDAVVSFTPVAHAQFENIFYQNTFENNATHAVVNDEELAFFFKLPPDGGNRWDTYDEPVEGCNDTDGDGFCDTPYVIDEISGATDEYPRIKQPEFEDCCSSVIFLPGLKGSELSTGSDKLWPPAIGNIPDFSEDVLQLAIDPITGESVNPITVDGILENFYVTPIYSGFVSFMDDVVAEGTIEAWEAFPYDWRFGPEKVIADENMLARLESLAAGSDTGQVTIITHSMGGLVGKVLIKELEELGKEGLVDSFVMVGVPQLGTPQAAASLLHGDDEGVLGGIIVDASHVREVAQNMPAAYNLLPSSQYFEEVADPVIVFNENAGFTQEWRDFWGSAIDNYLDFFAFITGGGVARTDPSENQLRIPEILRPDLAADANDLHAELDSYAIPNSIRTVQLAGWGLPTTKGIKYKTKHFLQNYEPALTREGDKTVVFPSALSSDGEVYYFDLFQNNKNLGQNIQHRDLLSAEKLQDSLKEVIEKDTVSGIDFISETKPQPGTLDNQLVLRTNSPVIFGAEDGFGNFTGIDQNQDLSAAVLFSTEEIPGSSFLHSSDSQTIILPRTDTYTFTYKGIGEGPTTIELGEFVGDQETLLQSYTDIPTTPQTSAAFVVNSGAPQDTVIEVDQDGDGEVDQIISPDGSELSLEEIIALLKDKIEGLDIKEKLKKKLLKKVEKLEKKIEKKKQKNKKLLEKLENKVTKKNIKGKIENADAEELIELLVQLEAQSDEVTLDPMLLGELREKIESLNVNSSLKWNFIKKVNRLEKKNALINTLSRFTKSVMRKNEKRRLTDADAQEIIDLLEQIENQL